MYKFIFFLLTTLITFQSSHSQESNFKISGTIKGLDSETMRLIIRDSKTGTRQEKIQVVNQSFTYSGYISEFTHVRIATDVKRVVKWTGNSYIPVKSSLLALFIYPGADVKVSGEITDFVNAYPEGDDYNDGLSNLNQMIFPVMNEAANISIELYHLGKKDLELTAKKQLLSEKARQLKEDFIEQHPNEVASIWMLEDMIVRKHLSMDRAIELFNKFSKENNQIRYYKNIEERIAGYLNTSAGNTAPEIISENTPSGKTIKLSDYKGKYVIIDFWGTWCGACIDGMPKIKEYMTKYAGQLEIIGIAQDNNIDNWKNAIQIHGLDWHHIINLKNDVDLVNMYNVTGFPTKVLISPEGKIIGRWVGEGDEGEEMYKTIDELLQ